MADITIDSIKNFLKKTEANHKEEMPTGAQTLLSSLINCETSAISATSSDTITFGKATIRMSAPNVTDDSMRKRVEIFNRFQESAGTGLKLKSRKHHYELHIDEAKLDLATAQNLIGLSKRIATTHDDKSLVQPELHIEPTVFISHKWHKQQALREIFHEFCHDLDTHLSHPSRGKPSVKLFYSTSQKNGFKPDSDRQTQQDSWCEQAQVGLIFWSDQYDHSPACQCELDFFIDAEGKNRSGKKAIVLLDHGRRPDMPDRLNARNTFFHPPDNEVSMVDYWEKASLTDKHRYIAALGDRIYEAFKSPSYAVKKAQLNPKNAKKQLDEQLIRAGYSQSAETLEDDNTQNPEAFGDHDGEHKRFELIPVLKNWANDFGPKSTRVSVLLGDFGFGKTVSCRLFNHSLSTDYQADPTKAPLPLYLDLKALQADIAENKSKPIEYLLESMLQKTGEKLTVSGEEIVQYIRTNPCLVIFDGFDEIGHHLNEAEQQAVYDSILDIIPSEAYRRDAERLQEKSGCASDARDFPSKLMISCRTHFFNRVSKEDSFISGSSRHALSSNGAGLKNIRRFYMAPFSADTVETYLCNVLGDKEGLRAKKILGEIHDLSELSSHPIMLDLITQQLPQLQALKRSNRTVNSAILYLNLFEKIGERDTGKHKIRLSDKQELLAALALHLWQKQQTSISFKHLDKWFADFGSQHRTIKNQLLASTHAMQELMQDLCNATLLVREKDRYRFAHTSYLEFFRAVGLFEAIREHNNANCFDSILGNAALKIDHETLQFFINWHAVIEPEDREEFDQQFLQLLESESSLTVRERAFAIWRFAHLNTSNNATHFPHTPKANWSGMRFDSEFIPDKLRSLEYSQVNLSQCYFHRIRFNALRLDKANFTDSRHSRVFFYNCELQNSCWQNTTITADSFYPRPPTPIKPDNSNRPTQALPLLRNFGHHGTVSCASFNHDSSRIISAAHDSTLRLWDTQSGECLNTFEGHSDWVTSAAFSHDSARIISAAYDSTLRLWDTQSGECLNTFEGHSNIVTSAAFSHDSACIISAAYDSTLRLWNTQSGECLNTFEGHSSLVTSAAFSHDSARIISAADDKSLRLWDTQSGKCLNTFEGHSDWVTSAAFSHDSARILSASDDNTLRLWDTQSGECINTFEGHSQAVTSAAFSHDSARILSASSDSTLRLWDTQTGECLNTFEGHSGRVTSAAFSHDSARILSAAYDKSLRLWDTQSGECLNTFEGHSRAVTSAAFSHDSARIISAAYDKSLRLWDTQSGECINTFEGHSGTVTSAAFSHDSARIISAAHDKSLRLWDTQTGECLNTFEGHSQAVTSAAFSHDSARIISAAYDKSLRLWDTQTGECLNTFEGHSRWVTSAAFSHDSARIISAAYDNTLRLWDTQSGECINTFEGHSSIVASAAFSHDSACIISASHDKSLRLWDTQSGECINTFEGHSGLVTSAAFSHDSARIISASDDSTLRLWDTQSGECINTFEGHSSIVTSAAFSHDSARIISTSHDNTTRLWDVKTGKCLYVILQTPEGEIRYHESETEFLPQSIRGDAWRYCYTKDADGNIGHPCQYEKWGEVYKP